MPAASTSGLVVPSDPRRGRGAAAGAAAIRGWIDVSFHVAAPQRNRALDVALRALHRGLTAAGETAYGYTGNFELRAVI